MNQEAHCECQGQHTNIAGIHFHLIEQALDIPVVFKQTDHLEKSEDPQQLIEPRQSR